MLREYEWSRRGIEIERRGLLEEEIRNRSRLPPSITSRTGCPRAFFLCFLDRYRETTNELISSRLHFLSGLRLGTSFLLLPHRQAQGQACFTSSSNNDDITWTRMGYAWRNVSDLPALHPTVSRITSNMSEIRFNRCHIRLSRQDRAPGVINSYSRVGVFM